MKSKFFITAIVTASVLAGYYLFSIRHAVPVEEGVFAPADTALEPSPSASSTELGPHREAPQGYKEYYNVAYRFSLLYPDDLAIHEQNEGGGARTITFQNPATAHGFQIFVVPYGASQVTEEQFKKDEPSGVRKGLQDIVVDGANGASFYSTNPALGETAEVWFVHGGYLFEVTTLKPLATWLSDSMRSWKFL